MVYTALLAEGTLLEKSTVNLASVEHLHCVK